MNNEYDGFFTRDAFTLTMISETMVRKGIDPVERMMELVEGKKLLYANVVTTKELAKKWFDNRDFNRDIKMSNKRLYRDSMNGVNGEEWFNTGECLRFDTSGKLIDGQTRISAFMSSNVDVMNFFIVVNVDPKAKANGIDLGCKRTATDQLQIDMVRSVSSVETTLINNCFFYSPAPKYRGTIPHKVRKMWASETSHSCSLDYVLDLKKNIQSKRKKPSLLMTCALRCHNYIMRQNISDEEKQELLDKLDFFVMVFIGQKGDTEDSWAFKARDYYMEGDNQDLAAGGMKQRASFYYHVNKYMYIYVFNVPMTIFRLVRSTGDKPKEYFPFSNEETFEIEQSKKTIADLEANAERIEDWNKIK